LARYTPEQIETCEALAEALVLAYGLQDVLGHDDIAPTRKSDPGPAFPLGRMRSLRSAATATRARSRPPMSRWTA
jgi:N-acetyl-anhydromuramyl-L-alanine amidase AmpD